MKIIQLLNFSIPITNEESAVEKTHAGKIKIEALDEHDQVTARNLVRKGIYEISKDSLHIIKKDQ
jgi:hypothetical protein